MMVVQQERAYPHRAVHLKIVKTVTFMLHIFYHDRKSTILRKLHFTLFKCIRLFSFSLFLFSKKMESVISLLVFMHEILLF